MQGGNCNVVMNQDGNAAGVGREGKPCGQNGRAQCQTRSKYDRYAGLLGCVSPQVAERYPQADRRWWPMSGNAVRIWAWGM